MAPSVLRSPVPLSVAELSAAALDGDLQRVSRTAYAPIRLPASEIVRARAAREVLTGGLAAVGITAAWIHGVTPHEPDPHHVQRIEDAPARRHWQAGVVVHTWPLPRADALEIAGTHVATLERTFYDLARAAFTGGADAAHRDAIGWFARHSELHPRLIEWLNRGRRLRYTKRAAQLLEPGQDDVTRYTS